MRTRPPLPHCAEYAGDVIQSTLPFLARYEALSTSDVLSSADIKQAIRDNFREASQAEASKERGAQLLDEVRPLPLTQESMLPAHTTHNEALHLDTLYDGHEHAPHINVAWPLVFWLSLPASRLPLLL